ncbi:MAG: PD40 domain-containing protein, partial [Planctomycetales bacterium]|nr:PD40 domain-containing protein [Planctomycetales bacterium]
KALHDDLQRFLHDQPTVARPLPQHERLMRWMRRSPATAALIAVSLTSLGGALIALSIHAKHLREHANALQQVNNELQAALADAQREKQRADASRHEFRHLEYHRDMREAYEAWNMSDVGETERILSRYAHAPVEEDARGFEWYALAHDLRRSITRIAKHDNFVNEAALFPDGRTVITNGERDMLFVYDAVNGQLLRTVPIPCPEITALAVSPDATRLALGTPSIFFSSVREVDAASGKGLDTPSRHKNTTEFVGYTSDGEYLISGSRYESVHATHLNGMDHRSWPTDRRNESLGISPDGQVLAMASPQQRLVLRNLRTDEVITEINTGGSIHDIVWSPSGEWVAYVTSPHDGVHLMSPETDQRHKLRTSDEVSCLGFAPSGRYLLAGLKSGDVVYWKVPSQKSKPLNNKKPDGQLGVHVGSVLKVVPIDDDYAVTTGDDGLVAGVHYQFGVGPVDLVDQRFEAATVSPDGKTFALANRDGTLSLLDAMTREMQRSLETDGSPVRSVTFAGSGNYFAAACESGAVRVWETATYELAFATQVQNVIDRDPPKLKGIALSHDGRWLAATGEHNQTHLWDWQQSSTPVLANTLTADGSVVQFHPRGDLLIYGGNQSTLFFQQLSIQTLPQQVDCGGATRCIALTADGKLLVSGHSDGTIRIHDCQTVTPALRFAAHPNGVAGIAVTPDGKTIVSADSEGETVLWESQSGNKIGTLVKKGGQSASHKFDVVQLSFSADGSLLACFLQPAKGKPQIRTWRRQESGEFAEG